MASLSAHQIETFQRDGVLVVNDVLDARQVQEALKGLRRTLADHGVDVDNLRETGHHLTSLSSTHGSGGVLDVYYPSWKLDICIHERLFNITTHLWEVAYFHGGESPEDVSSEHIYKIHPYGAFDVHRGYVYLDRIGFRLPTDLAVAIGIDRILPSTRPDSNVHRKKAWNKIAIQRSLTPHLDCCPSTFYTMENKHKWRPIQCFVSLTDTLQPSQGGFEAALGFHRDFDTWAATTTTTSTSSSAPCLGEYTHIRPKEDADIIRRIQHVPGVTAGSAVFWDNRIPHSNSYRHDGHEPRIVVYCSFLPDVAVNRVYVQRQLQDWIHGRAPGIMDKNGDRWIDSSQTNVQERSRNDNYDAADVDRWTPLGRKLMGIEPWDV